MDKLGDIGLKGAAFVDRVIGKNKAAGDFLNNIDDLAIASGFTKNKSVLSIADATKKVNPNYLTGKQEYRSNCFSCVTADLLNRANNGAGLDVIARPATAQEVARGGMTFNKLLDNWQGSSIDDIIIPKANIGSAKSSLAKSILDKCDGKDSFGMIRVKSQSNSAVGHYIKWEIKDGECVFSDSLSGTIGADKYFNAVGNNISRSIEFARVDGLAVNPFSIKDIVSSRI